MTDTQTGLEILADRILDLNPVSVLDVRAGSGALGTLLRSLQPSLSLTALEKDPSAYRLHEVYNHVLCAQPNTVLPPWWPTMDVVVLNGTLTSDFLPAAARQLWGRARDSARLAAYLTAPTSRYSTQWVTTWFFGIDECWIDPESGLGFYGWHRDDRAA